MIQTPRLLLRDFQQDDCQIVLAYQSEPQFCTYYPWNSRTSSDVYDLIGQFILWSKEQPRSKFQLAIILKKENKLIGNCGIRKNTLESLEAEFGCELDPCYWSQGYAVEAGEAIFDFGFKTLGLQRIFSICVAANQSAVHLAESLGMKRDDSWKETKRMKGRSWEMSKYFRNSPT